MGNKLSIEPLVDLCDTTPSQPGWNTCLKCSVVYYNENAICQRSGKHSKDGYTYNIHTELPSSGSFIKALWCADCGVCYADTTNSYCQATKSIHNKNGSANYSICLSPDGPYSICKLCSNIYNTKYPSYCAALPNSPHMSNGQMLKLKSSIDTNQTLMNMINNYEINHIHGVEGTYQLPTHLIQSQGKGPKYNDWSRIGNGVGINDSQWVTVDSTIQPDTIRYDLIVGFKISISLNSNILGINGVYYRSAKYIYDQSRSFYQQTNIGGQSSNNFDVFIPENNILIGLVGGGNDQSNIVALHMIVKNVFSNVVSLKPIIRTTSITSSEIFLYNEPSPITPVKSIMFRSYRGILRAITVVQYDPSYNELLRYCLQFGHATQTAQSVKLPQSFKSFHNFQSGLRTSEMILKNPLPKISQSLIPTSNININPNIDTKCLTGINLIISSNGVNIGGFKYNNYTTIDNPNVMQDITSLQTPAIIPNEPLNTQQIILPKNSYICGFAVSSTDPFNPSMFSFLPIIKTLSDPYTPIIIGDGIINLKNFPDFSYYYMDIPDYYCTPEKIRYVVKNNINDIFEVGFNNITHKVWSMLDSSFAGVNALSQYNYLDKQFDGIAYTPNERQKVATTYCGSKLLERKDDPETKACRIFATKISNIQMDDAINKFCSIHPTDDLCSCSDSYRNSDIDTINSSSIRTFITNNKPCFYQRCQTRGYMYTNQLDGTFSRPPKCDQKLSICEQTLNFNVSDNAIVKNINQSCQQAGYTQESVNPSKQPPTQQEPPTEQETNVQQATTVAENKDSSSLKSIGIIIIFSIIVGILFMFIMSEPSANGGNEFVVEGGYDIDINSPDYVVV